jgi:hypothetical protein
MERAEWFDTGQWLHWWSDYQHTIRRARSRPIKLHRRCRPQIIENSRHYTALQQ